MMNLINLKLILAIFINLAGTPSPPTPTLPSARVLIENSFADKLFIEGKYNSAITEYERLNFFSPAPYFKYQIGICYWKLGELERAATMFKELDSLRELTQVYLELGEYSLARFVCENLDRDLVGWIYMVEGRWDEAEQVFGSEELRTSALKANDLPYKSEILASILSIVIPGMGEIYANHWIDGALTFTLNAIAGVYAIKSFRKYDYITGGLIASFFCHRFYFGGIENAKKCTMEYNNNLKERYLKEIKKTYHCPFDL